MSPARNLRCLLLLLAGILLPNLLAAQRTAADAATCESTLASDNLQFDVVAEEKLLRWANEERVRVGAPVLELDADLRQAARAHAVELARHGTLSHQYEGEGSLSQRMGASGLRMDAAGENVAYAEAVEDAQDELLRSPGHHANMVKPIYNAAGFGALRCGRRLYITQDYARRLLPFTAADVEDRIFAAFNQRRAELKSPPLMRVERPELRKNACNGDAAADLAHPLYGSSQWVITMTQANPSELPEIMLKRAGEPFAAMAVGACFPEKTKEGFTTFHATVVLYRDAVR